MNIYDIPVNFVVAAKNQEAADKAITTFLNMSCKEFATENRIDSYELMDVFDEEDMDDCMDETTD